jgi:hypothetical protein
MVKLGTHEKPRTEDSFKRGEIYKNIALILVQKENGRGEESSF